MLYYERALWLIGSIFQTICSNFHRYFDFHDVCRRHYTAGQADMSKTIQNMALMKNGYALPDFFLPPSFSGGRENWFRGFVIANFFLLNKKILT